MCMSTATTEAPLLMHSVAVVRAVSLLLCVAMKLIHTDRELHVHECKSGCKCRMLHSAEQDLCRTGL